MEEKRDEHAIFMAEYRETLARVQRDLERARTPSVPLDVQPWSDAMLRSMHRHKVGTAKAQSTLLVGLLIAFIVVFWR